MNISLHVSVALCLTFAWALDCTAQSTVDSIDINQIAYSPEATCIATRSGDEMSAIFQAGIGVHFARFETVALNLAFYVGIVRTGEHLLSGYSSLLLSGVWRPIRTHSSIDLQCIGTVGLGTQGPTNTRTIQTVVGVEFGYAIKKPKGLVGPGIELIAVVGYGADWENEVSQEFVNVGLSFNDWASITFDISSLFAPQNSLMHLGRLR